MILDLKAFVDETLDIRMAEGQVLRIPKPNQRMLIQIMGFRDIGEDTPREKVEEALNDMVGDVLSSNIDGVEIDRESIAAMQENTKLAILQAYTDFMRSLQANPTMPSPACPARRERKRRMRRFFPRFGK